MSLLEYKLIEISFTQKYAVEGEEKKDIRKAPHKK